MANILQDGATVFSPVVDQAHEEKSFTTELESNSRNINWSRGKKQVTVTTILTNGSIVAHDKTKTYLQKLNDIKNAESETNTYTLTQEFDIKKFIDAVSMEQNTAITAGGVVLKAIVAEQLVPKIDAYRLGVLAATATATGQIVTATANGYADILKADAFLVNGRIDSPKKLWYVNTNTANSIRLSDHFVPHTSGMESSLRTGVIGKISNATVKVVPADLIATGFAGILVNPEVVSAPRFLDKAKITEANTDFGALIIGLYVYDCFVMKAKNKGVAAIKTA